jgi:hypothetical protein
MLRAFCIGHGVTVTAFLDGLGHVLCAMKHESLAELVEKHPTVGEALVHARTIDAERRNRERREKPPSSGSPAPAAADLLGL